MAHEGDRNAPAEIWRVRRKGRRCRRENTDNTPHYQVDIRAAGTIYRIAVNVKSSESPSELLYLVNESFRHPILARLDDLRQGFTLLPVQPGGIALDFIRGNLFDRSEMRLLPPNLPGPDNDLTDRIEHFVQRAIDEPDAVVFAFGQRWGPEQGVPDKTFGFRPGNGIHDIHMNQGNIAAFRSDDGVWQDGGLILRFPRPTSGSPSFWLPVPGVAHGRCYRACPRARGAAGQDRPNRRRDGQSRGRRRGGETVILFNPTPHAIDLSGWRIADRRSISSRFPGAFPPGMP